MRTALLSLGVLLAAAAAAAAEEAGGHAGVPWYEIFKQVLNVAILIAVLVYFLRKPVAAYLAERSELMKKSIEEAARARASAAEKLAAIEARVAGLADEIAELNRRTDADADEEARRIQGAAQAEMERLRAQVRFTADQEVRKAKAELRKEAAELSAQAAAELVAKTITPEDQERMVRENIDRIGEIAR